MQLSRSSSRTVSPSDSEPLISLVSTEKSHPSEQAQRYEKSSKGRNRSRQKRQRKPRPLRELYAQILELRADLYELRMEMRNLREASISADDKFMKLIQERRAGRPRADWDRILDDTFLELQAARDAYGPAEEAYNLAEEKLNRKEYSLKKSEMDIFSAQVSGSTSNAESLSSSASETGSDSSSFNFPSLAHDPFRDAYQSRLGDLDICREAYTALMIENSRLQQTKAIRERVGLELMAEDQAILDAYPEEESNMLTRLRVIEEDVEYLKDIWEQEERLGEISGDPFDAEERFHLLVEGGRSQSQYERFPSLLQKADDEEDGFRSLLLDFNGSTGDWIARWLLHKLQSSCLEVEHLFRLAELQGGISDEDEWQQNVISFWYADTTNHSSDVYELYRRYTASTVLTYPITRRKVRASKNLSIDEQSKISYDRSVFLLPRRSDMYRIMGDKKGCSARF